MTIIACGLFSLGFYREGLLEFRSVAFTLPFVWLVSLAVRMAAQQVAVGGYAQDGETMVGPTGNLRTDYEYWPSRVIWAYSVAGQAASLALISISLVISAAVAEMHTDGITLAELFGIQGGWNSQAWASQILWVNLFLFVLHLLPTIPFDMRASIFALFGWRARNAQEPYVFRRIGSFDSHLAAVLLGVCVASGCVNWYLNTEYLIWSVAGAAAMYLFVASRWEHSRASELEAQYAPGTPLVGSVRHAVSQVGARLRRASEESEEDSFGLMVQDIQSAEDEDFQGGMDVELKTHLDLDDILRKVHRCGVDSLSPQEQDALLSASREIKAKREE